MMLGEQRRLEVLRRALGGDRVCHAIATRQRRQFVWCAAESGHLRGKCNGVLFRYRQTVAVGNHDEQHPHIV